MNRNSIMLLFIFVVSIAPYCIHDTYTKNATHVYLNDHTDGRLLQSEKKQKIRIFVDYTQVRVGGKTQRQLIKRITNITATYFYNTLDVVRLPKLYFPKNQSRVCNIFTIPEDYVTKGTIGDLGIICGNQKRDEAVYVAKSSPCAFLEKSKRPIWGMISWNNAYLKFDQEGFQQILFVGLHEMTHVLGFSASMYEKFPNQLYFQDNGQHYLNSPAIQKVLKEHFNCTNAKGILLEDQDGTLIASHLEQKVVGNEFMIASNKKGSYVSKLTLAFFQSIGWYDVHYDYAQPTMWGQNRGCSFLNIDNCDFPQFCKNSGFDCDHERTGIGRCSRSSFTGTCKMIKYFTNTICVDENYELKNLNAKLNALQRGGSNSRCFTSDFRQNGVSPTKLNNRCYISVCSFSGKFIYILVGSYIMVCRKPGQVISAPPGLEGDLTCPSRFESQCDSKKTCAYHCNKNGACINGQCLCAGKKQLSLACLDVSVSKFEIGDQGGFKFAKDQCLEELDLFSLNGEGSKSKCEIKSYSINSKCIQGTVLDQIFGDCVECSDIFFCKQCNENGCLVCDDKSAPVAGNRCLPSTQR